MKEGKIIRGIGGFYYVHCGGSIVYECKAKGVFRKDGIKPLPGDAVEMEVLDEEKALGNIAEILPRKNALIRPAVANIDQALVIFATAAPEPNFNLLDRFLVMMEQQQIPTVICFNKKDLVDKERIMQLRAAYEGSGYQVLFVSAKKEEGLSELKEVLKGKTTTVAGPSGVGKSSLINELQDGISMETGAISEKIERGRHTTRHTEFICIEEGTYILDTPGFSSLALFDMEKEELESFFPEIKERSGHCRFIGCAHIKEPDCAVREALSEGKISESRYENYCLLYEELKGQKKYGRKNQPYGSRK